MIKDDEVQALIKQMREGKHYYKADEGRTRFSLDESLAAVETLRDKGWLMDGSLRGANLKGAILIGADLQNADLENANLENASLDGTNLSYGNLSHANLKDAALHRANLRHANLRHANMLIARMDNSDLFRTDLRNVDLTGAYLNRANLSETDLSWANLSCAELGEANLHRANLTECNLTQTILGSADLTFATFCRSNVDRTSFHGTHYGYTRWIDIDLSTTTGLAEFTHYGPSTIGVDTLYKSKGRIPSGFLKGCGVPEHMIELAESLSTLEADLTPYFINNQHDAYLVGLLDQHMKAAGLRVWRTKKTNEGINRISRPSRKRIFDQIFKIRGKLVYVMNRIVVREAWFKREIQQILKLQKRYGWRALYPVWADYPITSHQWHSPDDWYSEEDWIASSVNVSSLPDELQDYEIPNFSDYKNEERFETAFSHLMTLLLEEQHQG